MPETRAYKLNEQRQPGSLPGTLIYYYYGPDGRLTSQEVSEELFDALSDMDEKFYALERREEYHNVKHLKPSPHNHVFRPRKVEDLPDKKMADVLQQQEDSTDLLDARALFRGDDKRIYRMHFLEKLTQEEIAAALNRSQSYVSKRLAKIKETLESKALQQDRSKKEAYAERQWEQFLEKFRTENDEDYIDFEKAKNTNLNTISTRMKRLLPNHHPHELRHTFISRCKEAGVASEVVSIWAGHSLSGTITSTVYTHYSEEFQLKEAEKVAY